MEAVAYGLRSYAFGSGNAGLHAHSAFACEASAIWGLLELDGGGLASALPLVALAGPLRSMWHHNHLRTLQPRLWRPIFAANPQRLIVLVYSAVLHAWRAPSRARRVCGRGGPTCLAIEAAAESAVKSRARCRVSRA